MVDIARIRLTPLYDVLSAWPVTGRAANQLDAKRLHLAMGVKGKSMHYRLGDIQRRHFNHTARLCGWGENMEGLIAEVLDSLTQVLTTAESLLPTGFPEEVFAALRLGMQDRGESIIEDARHVTGALLGTINASLPLTALSLASRPISRNLGVCSDQRISIFHEA